MALFAAKLLFGAMLLASLAVVSVEALSVTGPFRLWGNRVDSRPNPDGDRNPGGNIPGFPEPPAPGPIGGRIPGFGRA